MRRWAPAAGSGATFPDVRILVTGMSGTVAPRFARAATSAGHEVVPWVRGEVSPDDADACHAFLDDQSPDAIVHAAFGAESWCGLLASYASLRTIPFVFTSTTMVFAPRPDGPYTITSPRTATDEYGSYKIRCEDAVWEANPGAMVARLGYQIDPDGLGNNMVAHTDAQHAADAVWSGRAPGGSPRVRSWTTRPPRCCHWCRTPSRACTTWTATRRPRGRTRASCEASRPRSDGHGGSSRPDEPDHDQRLIDSTRIAGLDARLT